MDTDSQKHDSMDAVDDVDDGEMAERRHRRDFVGTELERPKKNSRQRGKKRNRSGLHVMDDSDAMKSNSAMELEAALRTYLLTDEFRVPPFHASFLD